MLLQINKFMVRHEGKLYKQGDVVELPDDMAKALAENSAGAYSLLESPPAKKTKAVKADDVSEVLAKSTKRAKK